MFSSEYEKKCSGKVPVKNYGTDYLLPLSTEFIDLYDPDILWLDADWSTSPLEIPGFDIAAYFYNHAGSRKEVAINDRFPSQDWKTGRWKVGDFFTDESDDMNTSLGNKYQAWEECRGISISYGFNWQDTEENVVSSKDFIKMFLEIVSKGGNFLLITNLDGQGALPEIQRKRLEDIGNWLKVNGEGIYATRMYSTFSDTLNSGIPVFYTSSKDKRYVYAITTDWPGKQFNLKAVAPKKGTRIYMLGVKKPLNWSFDGLKNTTTIYVPENLQDESQRPGKYAFTFRIEK